MAGRIMSLNQIRLRLNAGTGAAGSAGAGAVPGATTGTGYGCTHTGISVFPGPAEQQALPAPAYMTAALVCSHNPTTRML